MLMLMAAMAVSLTVPADDSSAIANDGTIWRMSLDTGVAMDGQPSFLQDVLVSAGDINRDGRDDLIIGTQSSGTITVRSGRDGEVLLALTGDPATGFGQSVGAAGDVNADGYDDIIWGEPQYATQMGQLGRAVVTSGRTGKTLLEIFGRLAGDLTGFSISGLGDLDGDGRCDIGIGSPGVSRVSLHSGADGALLMDIEDVSPPNAIGQLVRPTGDVDGDAVPDVLIGVLDITSPAFMRTARVHSGADGSTLFSVDGGPSLLQIDLSMDAAGDVDGDGLGDIVVLLRDGASTSAGVYGGPDGDLIREIALASIGSSSNLTMVDVAGAGDVDGDGHADILVGTLDELEGGFIVYSGDTGYILRARGFEGDPHVALQVSVQSGGDLNDDGYDDPLVAIHQFEGSVPVTPSRGRVVFGGDPWFIHPGDRIRDRLAAGQLDSIRFDAVAGSRLDVTMKSFGKLQFEPVLGLTAPSGGIVLPPEAQGVGAVARIRKLILPDTGSYSVTLGGTFYEPIDGQYSIRTRARPPRGKGPVEANAADEGIAVFLPGNRVQGTVASGTPTQVSVDLSAGSRLSLRARRASGSSLEPVLRVLDPQGQEVLGGSTNSKPGRIKKLPIPETGTYTVEVTGDLGSEGSFVMRTKARSPRGKARIKAPKAVQLP